MGSVPEDYATPEEVLRGKLRVEIGDAWHRVHVEVNDKPMACTYLNVEVQPQEWNRVEIHALGRRLEEPVVIEGYLVSEAEFELLKSIQKDR